MIRVDDAASAQPQFGTFTTAQGLSSNVVEAITLDGDGLVYVATSRGIDQFDPGTGHVRNLSVENDLKAGAVTHVLGPQGSLWFATNAGIAKYTPELCAFDRTVDLRDRAACGGPGAARLRPG